MRVTNGMMFNNAVANVQKQSARLFEAQQQVAAGKTILRPSDDPVSTRRILDVRGTLSTMEQFERNRRTINALNRPPKPASTILKPCCSEPAVSPSMPSTIR